MLKEKRQRKQQQKHKIFFEFRERDKIKVCQGCYGDVPVVRGLTVLSWEEDLDKLLQYPRQAANLF